MEDNNLINQYTFKIMTTAENHISYVAEICALIEEAAYARGTGIAKRSIEYIQSKIKAGHAVIALDSNDELAGFCYIETWDHGKYVANSGLIVKPMFRGKALAMQIKKAIFLLSRKKYPTAKIFGITTSPAVLKINSKLGYRPVGFNELTQDETFWKGCESCQNYDILIRTKRQFCLCTGMLFDPEEKLEQIKLGIENAEEKSSVGL